MARMARGRLITLEGGEGAGKTSQAARLCAVLEGRGIAVLPTREPGGSPGAEDIRRLLVNGPAARWDPLSEAMLHAAARRDHLLRTIRPALRRGLWVISDRFIDSMVVYQGSAQGADAGALAQLNALALEGFEPDLTLILDVPVEEGLRRADMRTVRASRYERMDKGFHRRVREGFIAVARHAPDRCAVVDASREAGAVQRTIEKIVAERLFVAFDD